MSEVVMVTDYLQSQPWHWNPDQDTRGTIIRAIVPDGVVADVEVWASGVFGPDAILHGAVAVMILLTMVVSPVARRRMP